MPRGTWAIIPVKPLSEGKSRLGQEMTDASRAQLTLRMFDAVARAVRGVEGLAGWVVISRDDAVLSRARALGGAGLRETGPGLNRALEEARQWCCARGADAVLVLHADLPLLTSGEVEEMLESAQGDRCLLLAPSLDGTGTNALLARPPDLIRFSFGVDSLARHLAEARRVGVSPFVFRSTGTAQDVDTPDDLRRWRLGEAEGADCTSRSDLALSHGVARQGRRG